VVGCRVAPNPAPTRQPLPRQDLHVGAPQAPARPQTAMSVSSTVPPRATREYPGRENDVILTVDRRRRWPDEPTMTVPALLGHEGVGCSPTSPDGGSAPCCCSTTSGGALLTVLLGGHRYQPAYAMRWTPLCPRGRGPFRQVGTTLATSLGVLRVPPGPPLPGIQPGQQVVHLAMASSTGLRDAQPLRDALADLPAPLVDTWGPADAAKLSAIHMDPPVAVPSLGMARWLTESAASIAVDILSVAIESPILMMELRHVTNAAPVRDGAASRVAGDFMLHAVGDAADADGVPHLEAAFSSVRRAASAADSGLAIGSWAEGRQSVPDALPQDVRGRVISARQTVDPEGLIAASRLINGG
jgi:hypothetical protein